MIEPPKPMTPDRMSSDCMSRPVPCSFRMRSTPSRRSVTLSTSRMAMLVSTNRKIRFMRCFSWIEEYEPYMAALGP
jgi:hypothetical protein